MRPTGPLVRTGLAFPRSNAPHEGLTRFRTTPGPRSAFLLDTSRTFYPLPALLQTLETMSSVKMNVFHWHIVDAQAWPLESATFPDLARSGAYSANETYSLDDVRQVVKYAGERGIAVLLEVGLGPLLTPPPLTPE